MMEFRSRLCDGRHGCPKDAVSLDSEVSSRWGLVVVRSDKVKSTRFARIENPASVVVFCTAMNYNFCIRVRQRWEALPVAAWELVGDAPYSIVLSHVHAPRLRV